MIQTFYSLIFIQETWKHMTIQRPCKDQLHERSQTKKVHLVHYEIPTNEQFQKVDQQMPGGGEIIKEHEGTIGGDDYVC